MLHEDIHVLRWIRVPTKSFEYQYISQIFGNDIIPLGIYVDNIIIVSSEASVIQQNKYNMNKPLEIANLGPLH